MPKNKNAVKEPRAQKKDGFFKKTCKTLADASLGTEYKTVAAEEKQRFPVMMIIAAAVTTALFMLIIFSFMQISQIRSDMAKMESTIRSLEKEERKAHHGLCESCAPGSLRAFGVPAYSCRLGRGWVRLFGRRGTDRV